ncbi:MAG: MBL fold metallo-hydrolase [Pseudomonadota bacterium]|nr:MBL fold metallo-hydrolase [Pseudomonadota bacterium]
MRFFLLIFLITFSFNSYADLMRVIFLGTGTPRLDIERFSQSILIESGNEKLLFDVGRGATIRMSQANISLQEIDKVFLTHLHSDHTIGMPDLIMTGWVYHRNREMKIFGPHGTKKFINNIKEAFHEDIEIRTKHPEKLQLSGLNINIKEIDEGLIYQKDKLKVYAFSVSHGGGVKEAYGYKISNGKHTVVISGDTNFSENLVSHAKDSDLLIHEIAFAPKPLIEKSKKIEGLMNYHTTPEEMIKVLKLTKPRLTILTHVLALGGMRLEPVLKKIKDSTNNQFKIKYAHDLMAIDVKEDFHIYSVNYNQLEK